MSSVLFFVLFYAFCLLHFQSTVGREVDGPLWAPVMAALKAHVDGLGPLSGLQAAVLSRSRGLCGRYCAALWGSVGGLGQRVGPPEATRSPQQQFFS